MTKVYGWQRMLEHEAEKPRCAEKHANSKTQTEALATVVELASRASPRTKAEQRDLLMIAHEVDTRFNKLTTENALMFDRHGFRIRDWSCIEDVVRATAESQGSIFGGAS
jgi:hypothetical protein